MSVKSAERVLCIQTTERPEQANGLVYLAAPLTRAGDPNYPEVVRAVKAHFKTEVLFEGLQGYDDTFDWRKRWPEILPRLTALVVWPGPGGVVGWGCYAEIMGAYDRKIPVYAFWEGKGLCPRFTLRRLAGDNFRRYAVVKPLP
jgi:hypothetical protein